jgi:hypothetical protein
MLTSNELIKQISTTIGKSKVINLSRVLKNEHFALRDLIDVTFHPDKNIAFRAAWILENLFLESPQNYLDDMDYLLSRIRDVKNESCKRHYAKIMMHITDAKASAPVKQQLQQADLDAVVEKLFDWLIDPKALIAIKVFTSQALFNVRKRYPWITEELAAQILFLMRDGTAAMQSKGKKLLALL